MDKIFELDDITTRLRVFTVWAHHMEAFSRTEQVMIDTGARASDGFFLRALLEESFRLLSEDVSHQIAPDRRDFLRRTAKEIASEHILLTLHRERCTVSGCQDCARDEVGPS